MKVATKRKSAAINFCPECSPLELARMDSRVSGTNKQMIMHVRMHVRIDCHFLQQWKSEALAIMHAHKDNHDNESKHDANFAQKKGGLQSNGCFECGKEGSIEKNCLENDDDWKYHPRVDTHSKVQCAESELQKHPWTDFCDAT